MIVGFRHKGLQRFFERNDGSRLPVEMIGKIRLILSVLDAAERVEDVDQPAFRLHALKGDMRDLWAVTVRANWRIVFRFQAGEASEIDFLDYH